jgi:hypothetical protein
MGSKRFKKSSTKPKQAKVPKPMSEPLNVGGPTAAEIAELAVDLWKLGERAKAEAASERVAAAYERAEDRLKKIGFDVDPMVGRPYDTNIKAKVVDHEASEGPLLIGQCISPAVFFRGLLVREAEIVTIGGEEEK